MKGGEECFVNVCACDSADTVVFVVLWVGGGDCVVYASEEASDDWPGYVEGGVSLASTGC